MTTGRGTRPLAEDFGLLVLRCAGLGLALYHGWGKVEALTGGEGGRLVEGVAALGFPRPLIFAWAAALSEFAGGLLLMIGLATRPAAAFVAFTMGVAAFRRHHAAQQWLVALGWLAVPAETVQSWGKPEMALLYLALSLALLLTGAGGLSLDALFAGGRGRR